MGKDRSDKEFALRRRFIDYGFIMAWTKNGLAKVDIFDYWPLKESLMDSSTWHCYKPLIESVNDLIREPLNEMVEDIIIPQEDIGDDGYPMYYK